MCEHLPSFEFRRYGAGHFQYLHDSFTINEKQIADQINNLDRIANSTNLKRIMLLFQMLGSLAALSTLLEELPQL